MPRGIRGIRRCELFDRVWGLKLPLVSPYTWPPESGYPGEDLPSAVIVPARCAPFQRGVGGIAAGAIPPEFEAGFEVQLFPWREPHRTVRDTLLATLTETTYGDADATCWGARVTYTDDVQSHVHYLFTNQDDEASSVSVWNRIDIEARANDVKWFRKRDYREGGYGDYTTPTLTNLGGNRGPDEMCRPNQWGVGLDYFVFSSYQGNPASYGPWAVSRWKREDGDYIVRDHFEQFAGLDDETQHTVLLPAPRTYRYTSIPAGTPQEPWVIAHAPDTNGGELVTGVWLSQVGGFETPHAYLTAGEIRHVLRQNWNGDVVCYNRIQQTDLVIVALDRTTAGNWDYFDGVTWHATLNNEMPTWITRDWQGRLYYGNASFVRQLPHEGGPGWKITASDTTNSFRPSGYNEMFQILPTWRGLDLRHWLGRPADATVAVAGAVGGVNYTFTLQNQSQWVQYGHIFNWTFSFDGQTRQPHLQSVPRYVFETFDGFGDPGNFVFESITERTDARFVFGRSYSHRNPIEFGYLESVPYDNGGTLDPPLDALIPYGSYPDFVHHGHGFNALRTLPHGDPTPDDEYTADSPLPQTASKCSYDPVDTHGECEKSPLQQGY